MSNRRVIPNQPMSFDAGVYNKMLDLIDPAVPATVDDTVARKQLWHNDILVPFVVRTETNILISFYATGTPAQDLAGIPVDLPRAIASAPAVNAFEPSISPSLQWGFAVNDSALFWLGRFKVLSEFEPISGGPTLPAGSYYSALVPSLFAPTANVSPVIQIGAVPVAAFRVFPAEGPPDGDGLCTYKVRRFLNSSLSWRYSANYPHGNQSLSALWGEKHRRTQVVRA